jgi:hypothetical protein
VDTRDRLRKEAQVRRYAQRRDVVARILVVFGAGAGQIWAGKVVRGALLLLALLFVAFLGWFASGVLPPPEPSPLAAVAKLALTVPLGIVVYGVTLWDGFRKGG